MRPTLRTLYLIMAWALLAFVIAFTEQWETLIWLWKTLLAVFVIGLCLDALRIRNINGFTCIRKHNDHLAIGVWSDVEIRIRHTLNMDTALEIHDHYPQDCVAENPHQHSTLKPDKGLVFHYRIKPLKRGDHHFDRLDLLITSPFGLWQKRQRCGETTHIKVYPNFAAVSQYAMLSMDQQSVQMGIRKQQRRGEGLEFHQLRELRQGDSLRQIDWRASARLRKLISKDYQDEKDQEIFFLIDCGRRMRSQDGDFSHLDHALNAMLLMSYAALKQGDAIGLMSFGSHDRWLKPVKSTSNMSKILNQVYDLEASQRASDYSTAIKRLITQQKKRALVVLLSCIRDENSDDLQSSIASLQRKHLVLIANLEEPEIQCIPEQPVHTFDDALRYSGAVNYLEKRKQATRQLNHLGITTVNCTPQDMPVALVNKYFEIKREGLL